MSRWILESLRRMPTCGQCGQSLDEAAAKHATRVLAHRMFWNLLVIAMLAVVIVYDR